MITIRENKRSGQERRIGHMRSVAGAGKYSCAGRVSVEPFRGRRVTGQNHASGQNRSSVQSLARSGRRDAAVTARLIRRIERRNRVRLIAAVLIAAAVTFIATFAGMKLSERSAGADIFSAGGAGSPAIAYRTVQIEHGDTLWSIADREMDGLWKDRREFIRLVKKTNGLSGDAIHAGAYLCIPFHPL